MHITYLYMQVTISHTISLTPLQQFPTFSFTSQREMEARRMKGLTMVQWINLNRNNRSVLAHRYSVLGEKTGPILLLLVGLMAGRHMKYGWISKFLKHYKLTYSGFYLV